MSDDSLARSQSAAPSSVDADYDAIHATIVATGRGRWFLDEYANRYRGADTERVLAAVARIEQALSAGAAAEPADTVQAAIMAIAAAIQQTRSDVIGRHGDPAASAEAAIADFRHAAEQIQELVWAAANSDAGTDLTSQLSFQTNRLASAGDRLERSAGGLRAVLELLDEIDLRIRGLVDVPAPAVEAAPEPLPAAEATHSMASPVEWPVPAAAVAMPGAPTAPPADAMPIPAVPDQPPPPPETADAEVFWDLTVAPVEPDPAPTAAAAAADPVVTEVSISDWAFAPADAEPKPAADSGRALPPLDIAPAPEPPPAEPLMSALDRLEAREYGRQRVATAVAPPPHAGGLDDLVMESAPERDAAPAPAEEPQAVQWTLGPAPEVEAAESNFDSDLFDTQDADDAVPATRIEAPAPAMDDLLAAEDSERPPEAEPAPVPVEPTPPELIDSAFVEPTPEPAPAEPETAGHELLQAWPEPAPELPAHEQQQQPEDADAGADTPSVLQRLEDMRSAIAALMDEVSEKTARRTPPRP